MPYIPEEKKSVVRKDGCNNGGELNFLITEELQEYFVLEGGRYQQIHEISRAVEAVKLCIIHDDSTFLGQDPLSKRLYLMIAAACKDKLTFADSIAALEEARAEFRRRVVARYEDKAIERNGDVMNEKLKEILK